MHTFIPGGLAWKTRLMYLKIGYNRRLCVYHHAAVYLASFLTSLLTSINPTVFLRLHLYFVWAYDYQQHPKRQDNLSRRTNLECINTMYSEIFVVPSNWWPGDLLHFLHPVLPKLYWGRKSRRRQIRQCYCRYRQNIGDNHEKHDLERDRTSQTIVQVIS